MTTSQEAPRDNCANCRHHSKQDRPKVIGEVFDTIVEFEDKDQTVFVCVRDMRRPTDIGPEPIHCEHHQRSEPRKLSPDLERLLKQSERRTQAAEREAAGQILRMLDGEPLLGGDE